MAEIGETDLCLCIVCTKPASTFYEDYYSLEDLSKESFKKPRLSSKGRKSNRLKLKHSKFEQNVVRVDSSKDEETNLLLLPQLRVVFLLKQIFKQSLRGDGILEIMRKLGDPSEWCEICKKCTELVDEGVEVIRKLKLYEEERKRIVLTLKAKFTGSYNDDVAREQYVQDKFSKVRLDFRNRVRHLAVDVKEEVESELLDFSHQEDDWVSNDGCLEFPSGDRVGFDEFLSSSADQGEVSGEASEDIKKLILDDSKEVPLDYVKKIRRVWSNYKKDPDFVCNSSLYGKGSIPNIKSRKSDRNKSLGRSNYKTEPTEEQDPELTKDEHVALVENTEDEELETLEMIKRNKKILRKVYKAKSTNLNLHVRWRRKYNGNKAKNIKLKRVKATVRKSNRLERVEYVDKIPTAKTPSDLMGRPKSKVVSEFFMEKAHEHLDMNLIPYPTDKEKIPTGGKCTQLHEEGASKQRTDFPCPACKKYFGNKYFAIAHIHRVHLGIEKPWRCNECPKAHSQYRRLRYHLRDHKLGTLITCPICKKHSRQQQTMDNHILNHEKGKDAPTCHLCGKSFGRFPQYVKHMKEEHGIAYTNSKKSRSFVCELCSATFNQPKRFGFHKVKVHGEVDQEGLFPICAECSEVLFDEADLEKHAVRVHGRGSINYFCEHCGKGYILRSDLNCHVKQCGDNDSKMCTFCGEECRNQSRMERHIARVHSETVNMSMEEINEYVKKQKEEIPFKCKLCPQAFPFSNLLFWHHRKDHPEITDKFKCSECGKGFSRQCSVKRHYESTHLKLEYKCENCGKVFFARDSLKQHNRSYCKATKNTQNLNSAATTSPSDRPPTINQTPELVGKVEVPFLIDVRNDVDLVASLTAL